MRVAANHDGLLRVGEHGGELVVRREPGHDLLVAARRRVTAADTAEPWNLDRKPLWPGRDGGEAFWP